tara:strand:+ start:63 stop:248 length:186 start_codon:yes stop_codon:yes gene_type:complete
MLDYDISVGFYPGVLVGVRTYKTVIPTFDEDGKVTDTMVLKHDHVLYLPFIDIKFTTYTEE